MTLRTAEEYLDSLDDDRVVYAQGERVDDVVDHPVTGVSAKHAAGTWDLQHRRPDRFVYEDDGASYSSYFRRPRVADDLLARRELIEESTREHMGVFNIVQAVGTDILFTLLATLPGVDDARGTDYTERARAFYDHCRDGNLAMACAMTDPKGDRSKPPQKQSDPDVFLRVVEDRDDGVVVRGAKMHTTLGPVCEELLVLPTVGLGPDAEAYAIAGAVPADTDGVRMICRPPNRGDADDRDAPTSGEHDEVESLTVFDDVFIPEERVFLNGETEFAASLVGTFVTYHRFTALAYKSPIAEYMLGAASLAAKHNGVHDAKHIREKLTDIIEYIYNIRAFGKTAALECNDRNGVAVPHANYCNFGKYNFASRYHLIERHVQDVAGGIATTAPSAVDLDNPEIADDIRRFFAGAGDGADRFRLANYIRDLTASDFSGWHEVTSLHGEGSMQAQRITGFHEFDVEACERLVADVIDIDPNPRS